MGPLLFRYFNNLFYVKINCEIVYHADDNHLYYAHHCYIDIVPVQYNLILPTDNIRVLGVSQCDHLKFDSHKTNICIAASRQINALKRLAKLLNVAHQISIIVTWMFCGLTK